MTTIFRHAQVFHGHGKELAGGRNVVVEDGYGLP